MHAVTLHNLSHMHQFPQQRGGTRRGNAQHHISCFGRCQVMTDRANSANTRSDQGHFKHHASFAKFFKAAEFVDMQISMINSSSFIKIDGYFGMTFNSGHGFNCDFLGCHKNSYDLVPHQFIFFQIGYSALSQFTQYVKDDVSIWRAAGYEDIHRYHFMDGAYQGGFT